jgi:hypothetical protein
VWIDNNQVSAIVKGDGYTQTTAPSAGDVGIYTKNGDLSTTVHGVKVDLVDSNTGKVEEVTSKGGITPKVETTTDKAWSGSNTQLLYYTKPKKQKVSEYPAPNAPGQSGGVDRDIDYF